MLAGISFICLAICGTLAEDAIVPGAETISYRLPDVVDPLNYDISLDLSSTALNEFDTTNLNFEGTVVISAQSKSDNLRQIRMHAANMTINNVTVVSKGLVLKRTVDDSHISDEYEFLDINLEKVLPPYSNLVITIEYTAKLHEDMYGFYLSSYEDNNKKHYIATTQFESVYARRAFPCFDEPQYKATFHVKITRPPGNYTTVSNMPKSSKSTKDTDEFEVTPKMSTYLLAFVISELEYKTGSDARLKVWARPEAKKQTSYTASIGMKVVEALDNFTDIKFFEEMIPKLDMMALPDFAAGAMENWGILTYRETALLYDDKVSNNRDQQRVASVVAHEMAHQWFGDYVTTKWWNSIWLNEGFATYFQYHITDIVESTWEMKEQFVLEQLQDVFESDSLKNTKRLTNTVNTPTEIQAHFGGISYNKGGSVIRMMEHFLGHDTFQKGLTIYLKANAFNNTVPKDLFNSLEEQAQTDRVRLDSNVEHIMSTWVDQPGYPVVYVEANEDTVVFTQQRFLLTENLTKEDELFWHIPISYTTSTKNNYSYTKPQFWLTPSEPQKMKTIKDFEWLIVNIQETGYYRVNYDKHLWDKIRDALKSVERTKIHKLNRAQIIDDAMNLARAGQLEYKVALDLASFLSEETDYYPWYSGFRTFRYLLQRYPEDKDTGRKLRDFLVKDLMTNLLKDKNFDDVKGENHIDIFTRAMALEWACNLDQEYCKTQAKKMFEKAETDGVPKNVRDTVYCVGIREGNQAAWNMLWNKYKSANVAAEKVRILNSLGCSKNKDTLNNYLKISVSTEIRQQDASYAFSAVYTGSSIGVELALKFLEDNYETIRDRYGGMNALGNAITGLAARLNKKEHVTQLSDFLKKNGAQLKDVKIVADAAIENANANLEWAEKYADIIDDYLENGRSSSATNTFKPFLLAMAILITYINLSRR